MGIEFVFHDKYEKFEGDLIEVIPDIETIKAYYMEFDEKMRLPDLYGKSLKLSDRQFPDIYAIVKEICYNLDLEVPQVFIYENLYYEIDSFGVERKWIEISSRLISDFTKDEIRFALARELFKIKFSLTEKYMICNQLIKMLNEDFPNIPMSENLSRVFQVKYAQWSRCAQCSADNYGYLAVGSIDVCVNVILKFIFNNQFLIDNIDINEYLRDTTEINNLTDVVSTYTKNDEKIPYGQFRIKRLIAFASNEKTINYFYMR